MGNAGKILLLRQKNKILTLLIGDNRLLYAGVSLDEPNGAKVGNIYIGKIKHIVPNISAAFVEIENGELCFLSMSEAKNPKVTNRDYQGKLQEGDELVVQVIRERLKTKQAAVSTKLSISVGDSILLTSGSNRLGISNKLSQQKKKELAEALRTRGLITDTHLCVGARDHGMVIRTNAGELTSYDGLEQEWISVEALYQRIMEKAPFVTCYSCLYRVADDYLNEIRSIYTSEYDEIITDDRKLYESLLEHRNHSFQEPYGTLRFYEDEKLSLEKLYSVETKLENATATKVWMKSGGYLVIEPTEAMTVIDVNTGKYTDMKVPNEAYLRTNREAAKEIAYQLRVRNLSGIIIVDFINMDEENEQTELLNLMRNLVKKDSVKTRVIDITALGLMEITRKKVNKSLAERLKEL